MINKLNVLFHLQGSNNTILFENDSQFDKGTKAFFYKDGKRAFIYMNAAV